MRFLLTTYTIANYKDPSRFDRNLAKEICIHLRAEGIPVETEEISSDTIFVDPCSIKADHQGDHFEVQHADFIKIENQENGKFYLIDFQDGPQVTQALNEHPRWIGSSLTMFSPWWNRQFIKNDHRCIPGFYFPMHPCLIGEFSELRRQTKPDKRIFFSGTIGADYPGDPYADQKGRERRGVVRIVKGKRPDIIRVIERQNKFERREWWKQAARHWFNLSLPGHPWCNREFELWGLGLPVMAAQWVNPMLMNPLPNVHYIAVPGGHRDHTGTSLDPEFFADRIIETYFTFVKDYRTIERIAANGFEFYQKYLTMKNAAKLYIESIPWKEFE